MELEFEAVILTLAEREQDELHRLAYVGVMRARSVLYVIDSTQCREIINWR